MVASSVAGGAIERLDTDGMLLARARSATGAAQTWGTSSCDVSGASGVKDLVFKFSGGNFNFDFWQFTSIDGGTGGTGGSGGGGTGGGGGSAAGGTAGSASGGTGVVGGTGNAGGGAGQGMNPNQAGGGLGGGQALGGGSGTAPNAGAAAGRDPATADDSCACVVGPGSGAPGTAAALLATAWVALRSRRGRR